MARGDGRRAAATGPLSSLRRELAPVAFTTGESGRATFEAQEPRLSNGSTQFRIQTVCPVPEPGELAVMFTGELEGDRQGKFRLLGEGILELPSAEDVEPS